MEIITLGILAMAVILFIVSRLMAAQNTGLTVPDDAIFCGGGDPAIIYLTASAAITPGDNVEKAATRTLKTCDASAVEYAGTADLNKNAQLDDNDPVSHAFATGETVPVITGHCHVRKVADTNGTTAGHVQRVGQADGGECEDISTATGQYAIGRALTTAASGSAFIMNQW